MTNSEPTIWTMFVYTSNVIRTSPPEGGCEVLFSPCLSVCMSVCPANVLVFHLSAIRRDIDLKFIQDTYKVVLN